MDEIIPKTRKLKVYSLDPLHSTKFETWAINEATITIPWESLSKPGPIGDYLEVIDYDPASECFYQPVDLNDRGILAQDGLSPSEGNPQFHQQMVYAVTMLTIRNFERALGRCMLWSERPYDEAEDQYVPKLRIYPHGLREANAFYSPGKKALLFGYFPVLKKDYGDNLPGGVVFTCLSHDIIAHETTHALLDGLHRRFIEASNPDVIAFHEAFADIVSLFQHFSLPGLLKHAITKTQGDLLKKNLLGMLAQQFGQAIGRRGALRDALGSVDQETGEWKPLIPDPTMIDRTYEPHDRGSILVAAVFDAFLTIYKSRIADLLRIASQGTGILPEGNLHPDLVGRLAREAEKSAQHILQMCVRALDYCPPVDPTYGDFLRALITADLDMVPNDKHDYRIAIIEGFRKWGIFPEDVKSLSVDSLCWRKPTKEEQLLFKNMISVKSIKTSWKLWSDKRKVYDEMKKNAVIIHNIVRNKITAAKIFSVKHELFDIFGLELDPSSAPGTITRDDSGLPFFEVHSVRPAARVGPDGEVCSDLIIEITQRRRGYRDPEVQKKQDRSRQKQPLKPDFYFRGGCTLLIDHETESIRYIISKSVGDESRLNKQREFKYMNPRPSLRSIYLGEDVGEETKEPFAILHRSFWPEGEQL
jgi:hypothetical protein